MWRLSFSNMKRLITAFSVLLVILTTFSLPNNVVKANSVNEITIDIYIDENGDALVNETWQANLDRGTEGYRAFSDLGDSKITNFSVTDDSGQKYTFMKNWDIDASFENKKYKNGFNYFGDKVELCWGISKYGNRVYTLSYTITNFVTQYTDNQGIYFNLVNIDMDVENVTVKIHSDTKFSLDNTRIWGFGYSGTIDFDDAGSIVMDSDGYFSSSQYMVLMVRFEEPLFEATYESSKSFDDIYDEAFGDVDKEEDDDFNNPGWSSNYDEPNSFWPIILGIIAIPLVIIFNPIVWIVVIVILFLVKGKTWVMGSGDKAEGLDFGSEGISLPADRDINYWREIPCNKDLLRAYWVTKRYDVVNAKTAYAGILGAILLKWVKENKITITKTKKGWFSLKDNNYAVDFGAFTMADNSEENKLLKMLKEAGGSNNILEARELEKWCKNHYAKMENWFNGLLDYGNDQLEAQGLIIRETRETAAMFGRTKILTKLIVNPQVKEEAIQLKGLKKFLLEFSRMPEREYFEVNIWEEYLIFAQLLGIADKVAEQFSKLYPQFSEMTNLDIDFTTIAVQQLAYMGYASVMAGRALAEQRASESSRYDGGSSFSGGGGSSFSGGGGSSGGSSGGGFR